MLLVCLLVGHTSAGFCVLCGVPWIKTYNQAFCQANRPGFGMGGAGYPPCQNAACAANGGWIDTCTGPGEDCELLHGQAALHCVPCCEDGCCGWAESPPRPDPSYDPPWSTLADEAAKCLGRVFADAAQRQLIETGFEKIVNTALEMSSQYKALSTASTLAYQLAYEAPCLVADAATASEHGKSVAPVVGRPPIKK